MDPYEPGQTYYDDGPSDFSVLNTIRSRECLNCGAKINPGAIVTEHSRYKVPESDEEIDTYGEMALASEHLCEDCSDMYFNLKDHGYGCIEPWEVTECLNEYIDLTYTGDRS